MIIFYLIFSNCQYERNPKATIKNSRQTDVNKYTAKTPQKLRKEVYFKRETWMCVCVCKIS